MNKFLLVLAVLALGSCRSRKPEVMPTDRAPETAPMPTFEAPHRALFRMLETPSSDYRAVGTLRVETGGKPVSAKLDLRVRSLPESLIWMDVADPLIGIKIGRGRVYQDSVQGYIKLYRQYVNEPLSRLRSMGIDLKTEDARRLALGLPLVVPASWESAQWRTEDQTLVMAVPERRGSHSVLVEVGVAQTNPDRVLWQRLTSQGQSLTVTYLADGGWIAEVPSQSAKAEFRVSSTIRTEMQTFPFELPSDYARISF